MNTHSKPLPLINNIPDSSIIDVVRYGKKFEGTIPLWLGEGDQPTPDFISKGAIRALQDGKTFYTPNRGIPELRHALARYYKSIYDIELDDRQISVSNSGMHAATMIATALVGPGDNAVLISPCWPNIAKTIQFHGAATREVELSIVDGAFHLDLQRVFDACDNRTKLIYLASPGNPSGWMITADAADALLEFSRKTGIAIVSDEVYQRLSFQSDRGFTFLSITKPEDSVFIINSFSKAWSMTGWRLGWMIYPDTFHDTFEKLSQFSISGSPAFLQYGAICALDHGEEHISMLRDQIRSSSRFIESELGKIPNLTVIPSMGGIYSMFYVDGFTDDVAFCKMMIEKTRVGLAPGSAFGKGGKNLIRLCHMRKHPVLEEALKRMRSFLAGATSS